MIVQYRIIMYMLYMSSLHNIKLSVARKRRIPCESGDLPFSFSMTLFIFLYIPILAWVSGLPFVNGLSKKLYKILHALSVGFFRNAGGTPSLSS